MKLALALGSAMIARVATATPAAGSGSGSGSDDDAKLAAIQKAMNDLGPAVQGCWAAVAAAERFDIAGELAAQIDIGTPPVVTLVRDTTRDPALATCVKQVLAVYRWAPPLAGQSIQLPFKFRAPDGQSVIDRRLVPVHGQGAVSIAVLLDEANTGNPRASLFEIAIAAGGTTGLRSTDRAELWYFPAGGATASGMGAAPPFAVPAGGFVFVPAGGARAIAAGHAAVRAIVAVAPGGAEGVARAGALPTPEATTALSARIGPRLATAGVKVGPFTVALVKLGDRAKRTQPVTELLYVRAGAGTLTIGTTEVAISSTSAIQIPPGVAAALRTTAELDALQILVGAP